MPEDIELLRRYAQDRTEEAFAALVERHVSLVYSAVLRQLGGAVHRAEDVTQSVFVDLARRAAAVSRRDDITGWLYTSTHHAAAKLKRAEARRQVREREAHTMHEQSEDPSAGVEWERLRPVIDEAMHELGEPDRRAILLRFFRGQRFAEIGRVLGLREDAARMRVERALEKLHALLVRRGITSTSAALAAALGHQAVGSAPAGLAASVSHAAVSAVGGTAVSALAILEFMSTTKFIAGAAAVIAMLALGTAAYKVHARHEAQSALSAATEDRARTIGRVRALERRLRSEDETLAALQSAGQAAEARAMAAAEAAKPAPPWNEDEAGKAFQERHPKITQCMIEWRDAYLKSIFEPFWKSRGLTSQQIAEFKSHFPFAQRRHVTDDQKFGQFYAREYISNAELTRRMKDLLGEDGYREYGRFNFQYYRTQAASTYPFELARALCFTDTPLRPEQANQLVQVAAGSMPRNRVVPEAVDWQAMDRKADEILSAEQRRIWKDLAALGRARHELALATQPAPKTPSAK